MCRWARWGIASFDGILSRRPDRRRLGPSPGSQAQAGGRHRRHALRQRDVAPGHLAGRTSLRTSTRGGWAWSSAARTSSSSAAPMITAPPARSRRGRPGCRYASSSTASTRSSARASGGMTSISTSTPGTSRPECFPIQQELCAPLPEAPARERPAGEAHEQPVVRSGAPVLPPRPLRARALPQPEVRQRRRVQRRVRSLRSPALALGARQPAERAQQRARRRCATPRTGGSTCGPSSEALRGWIQAKQGAWRPAVLADVLEHRDAVAPLRGRPRPDVQGDRRRRCRSTRAKFTPGNARWPAAVRAASRRSRRGARRPGAPRRPQPSPSTTGRTAPSPATSPGASPCRWTSIPELAGKTLYVWPDSLIAPIAFSQVALAGGASIRPGM